MKRTGRASSSRASRWCCWPGILQVRQASLHLWWLEDLCCDVMFRTTNCRLSKLARWNSECSVRFAFTIRAQTRRKVLKTQLILEALNLLALPFVDEHVGEILTVIQTFLVIEFDVNPLVVTSSITPRMDIIDFIVDR